MEKLTLQPIHRFDGELRLPGSKSLSNRILLLSALARGETMVHNLLDSEDVRVMDQALRQLGVGVAGSLQHQALKITGCGGPLPGGTHRLFLGNAGTVMRPLTAVLAAGQGDYLLEGVHRMHQRPIGDLVGALRDLGGSITCLENEGFPPLRIQAAGLRGGEVHISGTTSSQFITALLTAAPLAGGDVTLRLTSKLVSEPYVTMTTRLMARYGVRVESRPGTLYRVEAGQRYHSPGDMLVEGDASSASYFLAGAAITGGTVRVTGVGRQSLQGDARFAAVLERMGARVLWEDSSITVTGGGFLRGVDADLVDMPDAAMTLAVAALFAQGPTTIRGIANWRVKETDRMAAMAAELTKLGAGVHTGQDHLTVTPPNKPVSAEIKTYDDHRMAMAFSLAACGGVPITILDPRCVAKTFPDYFDRLAELTS
ncbi:MAG: 3-phosphoshikimate 1-carboxyvinyltransferase [Deltaproteobacteria bacterium]|nr:3-phosphoshikimate 1-carboxyvinyltransferase [Deltaproteobacteria bacterium]